MRDYLAEVIKAIQRNLAYPDQARREGFLGRPVIRFTLMDNGGILPNSLAVHQSSAMPFSTTMPCRRHDEALPSRRPPDRSR